MYSLFEEYVCVQYTTNTLQNSISRIYLDERYPKGSGQREVVRKATGEIVGNIINAFRSQVVALNWLSDEVKAQAQSKMKQLVTNVAYPDWITNDQQLIDFYRTFPNVDAFDNFLDLNENITIYEYRQKFNALLKTGNADRADFGAAITWVSVIFVYIWEIKFRRMLGTSPNTIQSRSLRRFSNNRFSIPNFRIQSITERLA